MSSQKTVAFLKDLVKKFYVQSKGFDNHLKHVGIFQNFIVRIQSSKVIISRLKSPAGMLDIVWLNLLFEKRI